jgi:NADPH-dependent curcumin reductase CurA
MTSTINRQFRLKTRPEGLVQSSDFDYVEAPVPEPGPDQALVRNLYLSLDPTNRLWMSDRPQYMPPVKIGEVMRGVGLGIVVKSNSDRYKPGDIMSGLVNWQDYSLAGKGLGLSALPKGLPVSLPTLLGACGSTGLTAYFGLLEIGKPKAGETVVVSAAAGAVGSVVGQIAKIKGCHVVGIAGGPEKCRMIVEELGFDAAVDYKRADWRERLIEATPNGIDVNFENVGGEIMGAIMPRMNLFGRMPLCGLISGYNEGDAMLGDFSPILMRRILIRGFIVSDFAAGFLDALMELASWIAEGKLKHKDTIVDGLENAPTAINKLFEGSNTGKLIVKIADPD